MELHSIAKFSVSYINSRALFRSPEHSRNQQQNREINVEVVEPNTKVFLRRAGPASVCGSVGKVGRVPADSGTVSGGFNPSITRRESDFAVPQDRGRATKGPNQEANGPGSGQSLPIGISMFISGEQKLSRQACKSQLEIPVSGPGVPQ